mgnify:FL=1
MVFTIYLEDVYHTRMIQTCSNANPRVVHTMVAIISTDKECDLPLQFPNISTNLDAHRTMLSTILNFYERCLIDDLSMSLEFYFSLFYS